MEKYLFVDCQSLSILKTENRSKLSGIYMILNNKNNKYYIGSSKNIHNRWNEHKSKLNKNLHVNQKLQNSWNKYRSSSFQFLVIKECNENNLLDVEQQYLDQFKPYDRNVGYNLNKKSNGGDFYSLLTETEKTQFKNKCKRSGKNNGMFGKRHTEKTKLIQKKKSVGRFTLDWYIKTHGANGKKLYNERRLNLIDRDIEYNRDNKLIGTVRGPMTEQHKSKISNSKNRMKELEPKIKDAILSNKYTIVEMEKMFGVSKPTILSKKRKYRK